MCVWWTCTVHESSFLGVANNLAMTDDDLHRLIKLSFSAIDVAAWLDMLAHFGGVQHTQEAVQCPLILCQKSMVHFNQSGNTDFKAPESKTFPTQRSVAQGRIFWSSKPFCQKLKFSLTSFHTSKINWSVWRKWKNYVGFLGTTVCMYLSFAPLRFQGRTANLK